jgi:phosphonate transport system permease protein
MTRLPLDTDAIAARHPAAFRADPRRRAVTIAGFAAPIALFGLGLWHLGFSPARMLAGISELGTMVGLMVPPNPGNWSRVPIYLNALGETLAIAFLGTTLAAALALPLGFLAARNAMPAWIVRFLMRRSLDTLRGIDTLIWALIWVTVVGLGPFAGVLAIMCSDVGAFGKLFSEAIEAADKRPVEGVVAAGGSELHGIRFGLWPQVLPVMASQALYYIESNTRSATIIGIVGAGGIGLHLYEQIRTLEWQAVAFLVLLILVTVAIIDLVSSRLRFAIIGRRAERKESCKLLTIFAPPRLDGRNDEAPADAPAGRSCWTRIVLRQRLRAARGGPAACCSPRTAMRAPRASSRSPCRSRSPIISATASSGPSSALARG